MRDFASRVPKGSMWFSTPKIWKASSKKKKKVKRLNNYTKLFGVIKNKCDQKI